MIANRTVQPRSMLTDIGQDESAISIVSTIGGAVGNSNNNPGFGAAGSYYVNLRTTGLSKGDSLNYLSTHYKPPNQ